VSDAGLEANDVPRPELHVVLLDLEAMAGLNRATIGCDRPTDVLAFDYRDDTQECFPGDEPQTIAEVYVCPDLAAASASRWRTTPASEVMRYIVHGILHLSGLDDYTPEGRRRMRRRERRVLERIQAEAGPLEDMFEFDGARRQEEPPPAKQLKAHTQP